MVPIQTVQQWKERFSDIPDLEAAMTKLATTMLAKGRMHAGWTCPEGWMVGLLAEMNQEAADKKRITEARIARAAKGAAPASVGRSRRSELDAA
jgi:hypothetical protein